jgi:hypothetical protein
MGIKIQHCIRTLRLKVLRATDQRAESGGMSTGTARTHGFKVLGT